MLSLLASPGDRPQRPLGDCGSADHVGKREDLLLDLGREAEHAHDLGHPSTGDPFPPGDLGLARNLAGVELSPPLLGLQEEVDHPRRPRFPWWPGPTPASGDGADDPLGGYVTRQKAHVRVLERPLGPQDDLDRLVAVSGRQRARYGIVSVSGYMQDPEPDLGCDISGAVSRPIRLGSLFI